jgi:hypothetical protein
MIRFMPIGCMLAAFMVHGACAGYVDLFTSSGKVHDTLFAAHEYILHDRFFVDSGQTLFIQPGTIIRGMPGSGAQMSAFIVARGAHLDAQGTPELPIIFTAMTDNIANPDDLGCGACGLWGGVIICGAARIDCIHAAVEELPGSTPSNRLWYGGSNLSDNSVTFSYVSIRHAGAYTETGKPMPGLALCGLGLGSGVDHVEVLCCAGDGICLRGGGVSAKYLISAYTGKNAFDISHGYRGEGQNWFALQSQSLNVMPTPDRALHIAGVCDSALTLYSSLKLFNATFIGPGISAHPTSGIDRSAIRFTQRGAGHLYNLIVTGFPDKALSIDSVWLNDSYHRLKERALSLEYCAFWNIGAPPMSWSSITSRDYEAACLSTNANMVSDPKLRCTDGPRYREMFDPRQKFDSFGNYPFVQPPADGFFEPVGWIGAFGPLGVDYWIRGWTGLDQNRMCAGLVAISPRNFETIANANTQFDLRFIVKVPEGGLLDSEISVTVDGKDVTPSFAARCQGMLLTAGGVEYRVPGVRMWELGGVGLHAVACRFGFDSGMILRDTLWVRILQ